MKEITVFCEGLTHIAQFHEALARELNFPACYGANLDALHDLLTSLPQPTRLNLSGLSHVPFTVIPLLRVLDACQKDNPNLLITWDEP